MRNEPHNTFVGTMRSHVIAWRKNEGWSREAVVQAIVDAHEQIEGPSMTGIVFDPTTRDPFERQKVNAERVFRWLDDESKENNLLPANFIHSIWAAMPMDVRLHCIADCMRPVGVSVACSDAGDDAEFDALSHLRDLVKETAEAQLAMIACGPGATLRDLENARKEVDDVHVSSSRTRRALDAAITRLRSAAGKMRSAATTVRSFGRPGNKSSGAAATRSAQASANN